MDPATTSNGSKVWSWVIGFLALALIAGVFTWVYINSRSPEADQLAQTPTTTVTAAELIDEAKSELEAAVSDVDTDLAEIAADETSEDDTVDF